MPNTINFKRGLLSALPATANRDADTLYFVTDKGELYLGAKRISDVIQATAEPTLDTVLSNQIHIFGNKLYFRGTKTVGDVTSDAVISVDVGNIAETLAGLRTDVDAKVASVSAGDNSIAIGGTDTAPTVSAKISAKTDNILSISAEDGKEGLYVPAPEAAAEYTIAEGTTEEGYLKTYELQKDGVKVGASINIPKDFLVKSASVETVATADTPYTGAAVGDKYVDFVVNVKSGSATDEHIYLPVNDLVDVYTSGSAAGDMVVISIDGSNKITATISDGTITLAKLASAVQTEINKAHEHAAGSKDIVTVSGDLSYADGTLSYSHPTTTAVGAAFVKVGKDDKGHVVVGDAVAKSDLTGLLDAGDGTYDAKGSAAAVVGTSGDVSTANTVYGAKAYADSAVETAMTWGSF